MTAADASRRALTVAADLIDSLQEELRDVTKERDQLKEWRDNVSNAIKSCPEFQRGEWAGGMPGAKEGWGYHFVVVAWLVREHERLVEERTRLHEALQFYADTIAWRETSNASGTESGIGDIVYEPDVWEGRGETARRALELSGLFGTARKKER